MKTITKLFFLFFILVIIDQFVKNSFPLSICNKNIAWSIPISTAIFYLVWLGIIGGIIFLFLQTKYFRQKMFLVLIFSGAISNMADRIRFGCVIDYIDLKIFPVFNLADIYITLGIILFISLRFKKENNK